MGSGGGNPTGMTDFPPHMKTFHSRLLDNDGNDLISVSVVDAMNYGQQAASPYFNYITSASGIRAFVDSAFMGGTNTINSYPKIYELLTHYQDIDFNTLFASYMTGTSTSELLQSVITAIDDEITNSIMPKFKGNMRSIGAVQSSAYVVGEALIWDSKIKAIAKERIALEQVVLQNKEFALKMSMTYIDLTKNIVQLSMDITKYYFSLRTEMEDHGAAIHGKDLRWDLELFQYANNALSSISGAALSQGTIDKPPSKVASALGGALSGAAMGMAASGGNPIGAAVGGVLGMAGGLL